MKGNIFGIAKLLLVLSLIATIICGANINARSSRIINGRVIGGNDVFSTVYAFMALLEVVRSGGYKNKISYCGGSILLKNIILTAAHCVDGKVKKVSAHVGHFKRNSGKWYEVDSYNIIVHSKYQRTSYKYDIALLRTTFKMIFGHNIKAITLPKSTNINYDDQISYLAGWGQYDPNNLKSISDVLKSMTMTVEDHTNAKGYCRKDFICAEPVTNKQADGKGDSGGALFYFKLKNCLKNCVKCLGKPKIIGILSHSFNGISVFTRVAYYIDWINAGIHKLLQRPKLIINLDYD